MSCGCQDKTNDAIIIAEVERRKNEKLKHDYYYENYLFTGSLQIALDFIDENEIVLIEKKDDTWIFHLKKMQIVNIDNES